MVDLLCSWCSEPLQKAANRPTLCIHCFAAAAEIEREWFACDGKQEVEPEPAKKKIRTTPDCSCGGETFDAGLAWRCFECGRESPKETDPISYLWFEVGEETSHTWEHLSDALPGLTEPLKVMGFVLRLPGNLDINQARTMLLGAALYLEINGKRCLSMPASWTTLRIAKQVEMRGPEIKPTDKVKIKIKAFTASIAKGTRVILSLGYEKKEKA